MFVEQNAAGIGVVVRNSKVEVLSVLFEKIPQPPLVVLLQTMTARRAAYFIYKIGIPNSIFKGDLEIPINALWHGNFSSSSFGHLIKDIRQKCKTDTLTFSFFHFSPLIFSFFISVF